MRETVFNRCWALLHEEPAPVKTEDRVLDLRLGDEVMLEALVTVIRQTFAEHGFSELIWEHPPSEPSRESTPEVQSPSGADYKNSTRHLTTLSLLQTVLSFLIIYSRIFP